MSPPTKAFDAGDIMLSGVTVHERDCCESVRPENVVNTNSKSEDENFNPFGHRCTG